MSIASSVSIIEAAFSGTVDLQELEGALRNIRPSLSDPLKHLPKSAADRGKVNTGAVEIQGQRRVLSQEMMRNALSLSDQLDLNEIACVSLLFDASSRVRYMGGQVMHTAALIYHQEKESLLHCLGSLVKARTDDQLDRDVQDIIIRFTNELLEDGQVGPRLIKSLESLIRRDPTPVSVGVAVPLPGSATPQPQAAQIPVDTERHKSTQRRLAAEALFAIYYTIQLPSDTAMMLLGLVRLASTNALTDSRMFQVAYTLLLTFVAAIEPSHNVVNPRDGNIVPNVLPTTTNFAATVVSEVQTEWVNESFQSLLLLAVAMMLQSEECKRANIAAASDNNIEALVNRALLLNVFTFIAETLGKNEDYVADPSRLLYVGVLHDVLSAFITSQHRRVRLMKHADEDLSRRNLTAPGVALHPPPETTVAHARQLRDLLHAVGTVHEDAPEYAIRFWSSPLYGFVVGAGENLTAGLLVPYMQMLASLCSGEAAATQCHSTFLEGSVSTVISWSQFFRSLGRIVESMQETPSSGTMRFGYRGPAELGAEDLSAAIATLNLMTRVLSQSPYARQSVYDNPMFGARDVLIALLRCPVPPELKASLLQTLTAFAQSPEIAGQLWLYLEHSQVLATVGDRKGGIAFELDEVESRAAVYPETIAFLDLLMVLLERSWPSKLGAGYRAPGILPYIRFVLENVFVRAFARDYRDKSEMWKVILRSLQILHLVVHRYEIDDTDFRSEMVEVNGQQAPADKSPGYFLMKELLTAQPMLTNVLEVIKRAASTVDDGYVSEDSSSVGMQAVASGASGVAALLKSANMSLSILVAALRRQDLFADRLRMTYTDSSFVPLETFLMRTRIRLIDIARLVGHDDEQIALSAVHVIALLSPRLTSLARVFSEGRSATVVRAAFVHRLESDEFVQAPAEDYEFDDGQSLRLAVIQLLLASVNSRDPSLAHFLLDMNEMLSNSVGATPRSCLRSILQLIARPSLRSAIPRLAEACYSLVHALCSARQTGVGTLMMLRNYDPSFFVRHLHFVEPTLPIDELNLDLYQRSWVTKLVALELHVTAGDLPQRTSAQRLLAVLLGPDAVNDTDDDAATTTIRSSNRMYLLQALDHFGDIVQSDPPNLRAIAPSVDLDMCRRVTNKGVSVVDVALLHRQLSALAGAHHVDSSGELRAILHAAVEHNAFSELFAARFAALDAWKRLLYVSLTEWSEVLSSDGAAAALLQISGAILRKMVSTQIRIPLLAPLAECVLTIATHLRDARKRVVEGLVGMRLPQDQIVALMRDLLSALIHPTTTGAARGNLYCAVLQFAQCTENSEDASIAMPSGATRALFSGWGDRLINLVARDAVSGGDVWQSSALAVLSLLIACDGASNSVHVVGARGQLRALVEVACGLGGQYDSTPGSDTTQRMVFIAESALTVLLRIASSPNGADALLTNGTIPAVASSPWLAASSVPAYARHTTLASHGRVLLLPMLRLLSAMLMSLPKNADLATQVLDFVLQHGDVLDHALGGNFSSVSSFKSTNDAVMEELVVTSAILSRLAGHSELFEEKLHTRIYRIRDAMVSLLYRFSLRDGSNQSDAAQRKAIAAACRNAIIFIRHQVVAGKIVFSSSLSNSGDSNAGEALYGPPLSVLVSFVRACLSDIVSTTTPENRSSVEASLSVFLLENSLVVLLYHIGLYVAPQALTAATGAYMLNDDDATRFRKDAHGSLASALEDVGKLNFGESHLSISFSQTIARRLREIIST